MFAVFLQRSAPVGGSDPPNVLLSFKFFFNKESRTPIHGVIFVNGEQKNSGGFARLQVKGGVGGKRSCPQKGAVEACL